MNILHRRNSRVRESNKRRFSRRLGTMRRLGGGRRSRAVLNSQDKIPAHIAKTFFEMLNMIRLYHWNTRSFAKHKATEKLYEELDSNVDKFMEVMLGKSQSKLNILDERARLIDVKDDDMFKNKIHEYRAFLVDMDIHFGKRGDSDLISIRDDMLGDLNQFLYLLAFDR
jgi:DNA-binding ferritin-like protein